MYVYKSRRECQVCVCVISNDNKIKVTRKIKRNAKDKSDAAKNINGQYFVLGEMMTAMMVNDDDYDYNDDDVDGGGCARFQKLQKVRKRK